MLKRQRKNIEDKKTTMPQFQPFIGNLPCTTTKSEINCWVLDLGLKLPGLPRILFTLPVGLHELRTSCDTSTKRVLLFFLEA